MGQVSTTPFVADVLLDLVAFSTCSTIEFHAPQALH
jgi:hypothetical protein